MRERFPVRKWYKDDDVKMVLTMTEDSLDDKEKIESILCFYLFGLDQYHVMQKRGKIDEDYYEKRDLWNAYDQMGRLVSYFLHSSAKAEAGVIEALTAFVHNGGGLLGVNDPSAVWANGSFFQLAPVFGIDKDLGTKKCIGKYVNPVTEGTFAMEDTPNIGESMVENPGIYCKSANVSVLAANGKTPLITLNQFGAGKAMYLSSFRVSKESTRFLMRALLTLLGKEDKVRDYIHSKGVQTSVHYPPIHKFSIYKEFTCCLPVTE